MLVSTDYFHDRIEFFITYKSTLILKNKSLFFDVKYCNPHVAQANRILLKVLNQARDRSTWEHFN